MRTVRVRVPATVANLGPGFDVLGAGLDELGDEVEIGLHEGPAEVGVVTGKDAELVPRQPSQNASVVAAQRALELLGDPRQPVIVRVVREIPVAAGLGSSAAASVAGALGAAVASGRPFANRLGRRLQARAAILSPNSPPADASARRRPRLRRLRHCHWRTSSFRGS